MEDEGRGRANVEDTPELLAYYRELEALDAGALWTVANDIEPWFPRSESVPVLWRYRDLRPLVLRAGELVSPEKAARRVVMLVNPGRRAVSACVGGLYTGIQIMLPGEAASAHRHAASALRFIMEGQGAYTVVDHEKLTIQARDLVLTPTWTWHEHGHEGTRGPCIWPDGRGYSVVGGQRFDWEEKDIFVVPTWTLHEHANLSATDDACLFSFNDLPTMRALALYREEEYVENGGHQAVEQAAGALVGATAG